MDENQPLKRFLVLWSGQALSLLGSQLVQFALIWWLTETTQSATVLAIASLVGYLPQIVLGPFVGVLVDRWDRRRVMLAADTGVMLATLALGYLFATGAAGIGHVLAILFIRALAGSFHWPAMQASTTLMVPEKLFTRIQGLNQALYGALNIVAAPAGAMLMELLPIHGIIAIDVVTALFAIIPLLFIAIPQPLSRQSPGSAPTTFWSDLGEGLRYVRSRRGLMLLMAMGGTVNLLLNPAFSLLPILVTEHFHGEALHLGWLEAALGVGVVTGGAVLSVWGGFRRRIVTYLFGISSVGFFVLLLSLLPASSFRLAVATMFLIGVGLAFTDGPLLAILQGTIAPELQGRILMLVLTCFKLVVPLGLLIAGPLTDRFGVRPWFVATGALTLLLCSAGFFVPTLLGIEAEPERLVAPTDALQAESVA